RRYVLVFMPLTSILFGVGVGLWRRSTERNPRKRTPKEPENEALEKEAPEKVEDADEDEET
ncbi:MAG: hypothetical protein ABIP39_02995, partial [Polyangiaceae bacterium]